MRVVVSRALNWESCVVGVFAVGWAEGGEVGWWRLISEKDGRGSATTNGRGWR